MDKTGKYINLLNFCNTQISNATEYYIAKIILENISNNEDISLETLALKSHISQASISRFIKKAGFKNYQEFRDCVQYANPDISLNRTLSHVTQFSLLNDYQLSMDIFKRSITNLQATKRNLNIPLLKQILLLFKEASSVSFYGDDHALSLFYTLQIDLITNHIPSYLFKKEEFQELHIRQRNEKDVIVFLNVSKQFITNKQKEILKQAKENKIKLVLFCQDYDIQFGSLFDYNYVFGTKQSYNDGFYSLYYISQLLSELFYRIK